MPDMDAVTEKLLEIWHETKAHHRYKISIVIPSKPHLFSDDVLSKIRQATGMEILDFEKKYKDQLDRFIVRGKIRSEIMAVSRKKPLLVVNAEHFYDKWLPKERISFLRDIVRHDGHAGAILIIHCNEDLTPIAEQTPENSRGLIRAI